MTEKKTKKDRNKEVRDNLLSRIGHNLKRMFTALWGATKAFVGIIGKGLTATAVVALSIPAFVLLIPAAIIILAGAVFMELFRGPYKGDQNPVPEGAAA